MNYGNPPPGEKRFLREMLVMGVQDMREAGRDLNDQLKAAEKRLATAKAVVESKQQILETARSDLRKLRIAIFQGVTKTEAA